MRRRIGANAQTLAKTDQRANEKAGSPYWLVFKVYAAWGGRSRVAKSGEGCVSTGGGNKAPALLGSTGCVKVKGGATLKQQAAQWTQLPQASSASLKNSGFSLSEAGKKAGGGFEACEGATCTACASGACDKCADTGWSLLLKPWPWHSAPPDANADAPKSSHRPTMAMIR